MPDAFGAPPLDKPLQDGAPLQLGSGGSRPRAGRGGMFDFPDEGEFLKEGEKTLEWVSSIVARVRAEGSEMCCRAAVLGSVAAVFPRFAHALRDARVAAGAVDAAWVVPPFVLKDLGADLRWHEVRGRLGPFLKNDIWRRIDGEVRSGAEVRWAQMGLQAENLVVVKHTVPWRSLAAAAWRQASWAGAKQLLRAYYDACTREALFGLLVRAWPFRWSWLAAWLAGVCAIWLAQQATATLVPVTWHDVLMLWLANVCVGAYALKGRSAADTALSDAASFKTAGSVALRKAKLQVALEQWGHGEESAAKLGGMWYLNGAFRARGIELRVACLNNSALVQLKQREWQRAVRSCARALELAPSSLPTARAKALFRSAIGMAKLGDVSGACSQLDAARLLVPSDAEVSGLLRVLRHGEAQRAEAERRDAEERETAAMEAAASAAPSKAARPARMVGDEAARASAVFGSLTDPTVEGDASALGEWAPPPSAAAKAARAAGGAPAAAAAGAAAPAPKAHPAPPAPAAGGPRVEQRFAWAKEWLSSRLVGLACQDEDGAIVAVAELRGLRGEAYVATTAGPRAKTSRVFDLAFELRWEARVGGGAFCGRLLLENVASHAEPREFEISAAYDEGPEQGSELEFALVGLLGPLRADAALAASGRLTQQVWRVLVEFAEAFAEAAGPAA